MSNSVARETEEAVLESIRRLLTDGPPSGTAAAPAAPSVDKLLLTPALRVTVDDAATPAATPRPDPVSWSLEEQIAELEAAVGSVGDWEPDGSEDKDEQTPRHIVFQHRSPKAASAEAAPLREEGMRTEALAAPDLYDEDDPAASGGFDIGADDRLPDADALRDMVAEIVRAELQSDLGQRVTRNIRKLVRREIRRALAARDFD